MRILPIFFLIFNFTDGLTCLHIGQDLEAHQNSVPPPGMVLIPGGTFMMGCAKGDTQCTGNEKPAHEVTVTHFYLDKYEVTVEKYKKCVNAGNCILPRYTIDNGIQASSHEHQGNWSYPNRDSHPMNWVNLKQAKTYCEWVGKRLPKEAEWEYAARAGHSDWKYPWGNEKADCSRAVMDESLSKDGSGFGCGKKVTWPVGSKPPNEFGLFDMAGNIAEWVDDRFPPDEITGAEPTIVKGGSWVRGPAALRSSYRGEGNEKYGWKAIGFRCAKSVE